MSTLPAAGPTLVIRSVAPLGLAVYDPVTAVRITTGLRVTATSPWSGRPRASVLSSSGVHTFTGLLPPDVEHGDVAPPAGATAIVQIADVDGRFLPVTLAAPLGLRRVVTFEDLTDAVASPPTVTPVPLLSSPARELPAHVGAVRAHVVRDDGRPAGWCRVRVTLSGTAAPPAVGVADANGVVVVPVVYPAFDLGEVGPFAALSPPDQGHADPMAAAWPVQIEVRHSWDALARPAGPEAPPTLRSMLLDQPVVDVVELVGGSVGADRLPDPALAFGVDLVLQTAGDRRSRLIVTAASP